MKEKTIDNIIKEVNATIEMEGHNLKPEEKSSLRKTIIKNFEKLKDELKEDVEIRRKR